MPLFVKRPGQRRGRISDAYARTLDVPPTIADVLGCAARLPRRRPLGLRPRGRAAAPGHADHARLLRRRDASPGARWQARCARRWCARRLRQFGSGDLAGAVHRHRPQPRADRARGRRAWPAPRAAGGAAAIAQAGLFARRAAAPRAWCRRRSPATCPAAPRRPARPGGGRERPHRGRRALLPPRRRPDASTSRSWCPRRRCARAATRVELFEVVAAGGCACSPELSSAIYPPGVRIAARGARWWRRLPPWRRSASPWASDDAGAGAGASARPPVVVVVFDEFPADTLIGPDGEIDAERYPNFAALAAHLDLVPQRPDGLRLDLQGGAGDPRRAHAAAAAPRPTCAATSRASST